MSATVNFSTGSVRVNVNTLSEFVLAIASRLDVCPSRVVIYHGRVKLETDPVVNKIYRGMVTTGDEKLSFDSHAREFHFYRNDTLVVSFSEEKEDRGGYYWVQTIHHRFNPHAKEIVGNQLVVDFPSEYTGPITRARSKQIESSAMAAIRRDLADPKNAVNPRPVVGKEVVYCEEYEVECDECQRDECSEQGCMLSMRSYKPFPQEELVFRFVRDVLNFLV